MRHILLFSSGVISLSISLSALAVDCAALNQQAERDGVNIAGCEAGYDVIGTGRLAFYSAPNLACKLPKTFVIPKQQLIAYSEYAGFTSVMYLNPKTQAETLGWVDSKRIQANGTGIAPCQ
jgi:hypothetical protein